MTQLIAKLLGREMKSAGVMKRGPIVKRDNYQVKEQIFIMPHLLFEKHGILPQNNILFHNVNLQYLTKTMIYSEEKIRIYFPYKVLTKKIRT